MQVVEKAGGGKGMDIAKMIVFTVIFIGIMWFILAMAFDSYSDKKNKGNLEKDTKIIDITEDLLKSYNNANQDSNIDISEMDSNLNQNTHQNRKYNHSNPLIYLPKDIKTNNNYTTKYIKDKSLILKFWNGEFPLWISFWIFGTIGSGIINGIDKFLNRESLVKYWIDFIQNNGILTFKIIFISFYIFSFAYIWFVIIGTWRSSNNYNGPSILAVLTKIIIILRAFATIFIFINIKMIIEM